VSEMPLWLEVTESLRAAGVIDRISHLAHAVMAAVMGAMIWPMG
jgi:hypothetical protein